MKRLNTVTVMVARECEEEERAQMQGSTIAVALKEAPSRELPIAL